MKDCGQKIEKQFAVSRRKVVLYKYYELCWSIVYCVVLSRML
jgi:hypothetical protein